MEAGRIGPLAPDEEVLDVGAPRRPLPRAAWLMLVILLVGGGVIWLLTVRSPSSRPHAERTESTEPGPSTPPLSPQRPTPTVPTYRRLGGRACAGPGACLVSASVPRALGSAIRHFLPGSERTSALSVTREEPAGGDGLLVGRAVMSHVGASTLLIQVRTYRGPTRQPVPAITVTPPGASSAFVHIETAAYTVDMQWIASGDTVVPFPQLRALARDPRLEALP